ncbi:hypothetical protein ACHAW6_013313 [Cyclotella cf. meneghiniana]
MIVQQKPNDLALSHKIQQWKRHDLTSASIESASKSIKSIFSRTKNQKEIIAKSAPTNPWVSRANASKSTESSNFMLLVCMRRISSLPFSSGTPRSTSRSNRPKRRRDVSIELGRFVAAMTRTGFSIELRVDPLCIPSMSKKYAPVSFAIARAMRVFPHPGGP